MTIAVRFARRALTELDRIEQWSRTNHSALWPRLMAELAQTVRLLRVSPEMGSPYERHADIRGVRRVLLGVTQYYVYYRYHPSKGLIVILSIWSTRRRRPPAVR